MALNRDAEIVLHKRRAKRTKSKLKENREKIEALKSEDRAHKEEEARMNILILQMQEKYEEMDVMEISAIKIQKVIRGYLTRNSLDELVIDFRQKSIANSIKVLNKGNFRCLYHTGNMPAIAATVIQKAIKRFLFRRKIDRLQQVYYYKLHEKMYLAFALIRKVVYTLRAKQKARWKQFKIDRLIILDKMKYRLAVLQVKKHWNKLKLSGKSMLLRIRKYKRRLKNLENAKLMEALKAAEAEKAEKAENNEENGDDEEGEPEEEIDSEEERIMREEERLRQEKIRMGMIAYNIPKSKLNTEVMPFMYMKDLEEDARPNTHHQSVTRAIASRMSVSRPNRYTSMTPSQPFQSLFDDKGTPVFLLKRPKKRIKKFTPRTVTGNPLYMKETLASIMGKKNPASFFPPEEEPEEIIKKPRPDSTVMKPTESYLGKKNDPYIHERRTAWKPASSLKKEYLPSIDNSAYKPSTAYRTERGRTANRPSRLRPLTVDKPKVEDAVPPEQEVQRYNEFSLDFSDVFPEYSELLARYSNSLHIHVKPRTENIRGFK